MPSTGYLTTADHITHKSAFIAWSEAFSGDGGQLHRQLQYKTYPGNNVTSVNISLASGNTTLSDLHPGSLYLVQLVLFSDLSKDPLISDNTTFTTLPGL